MSWFLEFYIYTLGVEIELNGGFPLIAILVMILAPWIIRQLWRSDISYMRRRLVYYLPLVLIWVTFLSGLANIDLDGLDEVHIVFIIIVYATFPILSWVIYHGFLICLAVFLSPFHHTSPPQKTLFFQHHFKDFISFKEFKSMPNLRQMTRVISRVTAQAEIDKQKKTQLELREYRAEIANLQSKLSKLEAIKFQRDEAKRLKMAVIAKAEAEKQRIVEEELKRIETKRKAEHDRREKLRDKTRNLRLRRFKDPLVTRLYALYLDCFPKGEGWTSHGEYIAADFSARVRKVLQPCFAGEPKFTELKKTILKKIHADVGDARLSEKDRTRVFQLFYEIAFKTKTTN